MNYSIEILKAAQKQLGKIQGSEQEKIVSEVRALSVNPRPLGCIKLRGRDAWRIRSGDYRIIYEIKDSTLAVIVIAIGHRREIYR
ncbi:MAG: type II toxin-antitoxin system RelE/ParE family toxin [Spirochaetota bacterium]